MSMLLESVAQRLRRAVSPLRTSHAPADATRVAETGDAQHLATGRPVAVFDLM